MEGRIIKLARGGGTQRIQDLKRILFLNELMYVYRGDKKNAFLRKQGGKHIYLFKWGLKKKSLNISSKNHPVWNKFNTNINANVYTYDLLQLNHNHLGPSAQFWHNKPRFAISWTSGWLACIPATLRHTLRDKLRSLQDQVWYPVNELQYAQHMFCHSWFSEFTTGQNMVSCKWKHLTRASSQGQTEKDWSGSTLSGAPCGSFCWR